MFPILACFLLLGVILPVKTQESTFSEACSNIPEQYQKYTPRDYSCCQNEFITKLMRWCCTTSDSCLCNDTVCTASAAEPTSTPSSTTSPTTSTVPATTKPTSSGNLCPSPTSSPSARLLNSTPADSLCTGQGTIGFAGPDGQQCNGAYSKDPSTGKTQIYTLSSCWALNPTSAIIGNDSIPLDNCSVESVSTDPVYGSLTTITLTPLAAYFLDKTFESCPTSGCTYNPDTMQNSMNWKDCFVSSYGATQMNNASSSGRLHTVPVSMADATQCSNPPPGSQCFTSSTGSACIGDDGAPVYCPLSTGEYTLYGLTAASSCMPGSTSFNVIPVVGPVVEEIELP